jgi:hypothetical protein
VRIRGSGAAHIYDAAGGVPAGLRGLRITVRQLPVGHRPPVSRAPAAVLPGGAPTCALGGLLIADRSLTRQSWLLAHPFGAGLRLTAAEKGCSGARAP